jgi:hypothetical protein
MDSFLKNIVHEHRDLLKEQNTVGWWQGTSNNGALQKCHMSFKVRAHKLVSTMSHARMSCAYNSSFSDIYVASIKCSNDVAYVVYYINVAY